MHKHSRPVPYVTRATAPKADTAVLAGIAWGLALSILVIALVLPFQSPLGWPS